LSQGIGQRVFRRFFPHEVTSWCYASARRTWVPAQRMRQLVGRGSASAGRVLRGACLFSVCSGDETCPRTEGGQGDDGACCSAAGAFVALSRAQGLGLAFPGRLATRRSRAVGLGRCCVAQRLGFWLYFVRSHLGTITEGIFSLWEAAPSRAVQTFALRQAWSLMPGAAINRGREILFPLQLPCSFF